MPQQRAASVRFTDTESEYLMTHQLGRVATVSPSGQPHVVPVAYEFDGQYLYFGGWNLEKSLKFKNLQRNEKVALVIDDVAPADRWTPRGVEIRGRAEPVRSRNGVCLKVTPTKKVSWGV